MLINSLATQLCQMSKSMLPLLFHKAPNHVCLNSTAITGKVIELKRKADYIILLIKALQVQIPQMGRQDLHETTLQLHCSPLTLHCPPVTLWFYQDACRSLN